MEEKENSVIGLCSTLVSCSSIRGGGALLAIRNLRRTTSFGLCSSSSTFPFIFLLCVPSPLGGTWEPFIRATPILALLLLLAVVQAKSTFNCTQPIASTHPRSRRKSVLRTASLGSLRGGSHRMSSTGGWQPSGNWCFVWCPYSQTGKQKQKVGMQWTKTWSNGKCPQMLDWNYHLNAWTPVDSSSCCFATTLGEV